MDLMNKKELKQAYKQKSLPMGVFLIRNVDNDKVLLVSSANIEGAINRHKFQLSKGLHPNARLQQDWNELGSQKFEFEILDQIVPRTEPGADHKADLNSLTELWLEKLQPFGERGYNEKKLSKEEALRRIAEKRRES
jgi:hypothetical protein